MSDEQKVARMSMAIAAADLFGIADTFSSSYSWVQQRKHRMWLAEPWQPSSPHQSFHSFWPVRNRAYPG